MAYEIDLDAIYGKVIGYTRPLNPFTMMARAIIKINNRVIRIPVDYRQVKFIEREYPVGSIVVLEYDGSWCIRSQMAPSEFNIDGLSGSVYY
jgi:hypothetical protein